ncbi:DNA repair protein XRCC1-like [Musca vetustissima]|uniref:DNA repair protein XRCC1-like n=1 Tax=Musca vetustissima TaxID=27455 RepID=UPI002AB73D7A|nr:DNA repair protein XRCC1-like [Musca vetustissima]
MPFAKFSRIREVSSEDDQHSAENLIRPSQGKKWKTKSVGEKSAYVILELDEAQKITGIDIGNEHSAFIEVLVGKSSAAPEDFTEILITCSFMTPIESKNSNNSNRVRCFGTEALVPSVAEKNWSLIKIICTQPFNKHVQYGLSFIKVQVAPNNTTKSSGLVPGAKIIGTEVQSKPSSIQIGKFKLREDSPDSENDGSSSLFSRWKTNKDKNEQSTAAAIRNATNVSIIKQSQKMPEKPIKNRHCDTTKIEIRDRNRDDLMFGAADDTENTAKEARLAKEIDAERERRRLDAKKQEELKQREKRKSLDARTPRLVSDNKKEKVDQTTKPNISLSAESSTPKHESVKKRPSSPNMRPAKKCKPLIAKYKPFNQLLKGVVLVISGIQNPDRADLRSKAIALGAKYKGDWDNTCTHLICAFKNTPKYNQVKGKGKIVTRSWIEKCYNNKKYIPWRRFALDSAELTKPESDEEVLDESLQTSDRENGTGLTNKRESEERNETLSLYDLDEHVSKSQSKTDAMVSSSDSDTDDDIKRIEEKNKQIVVKDPKARIPTTGVISSDAIYDVSTDEEFYLENKRQTSTHIIV